MDFPTGAALEAWTKFGTGALFLLMYLGTIYLLIKELKAQVVRANDVTKQVTVALTENTDARKQTGETLKELKKSLEDSTGKTTEFYAYLKGKIGV